MQLDNPQFCTPSVENAIDRQPLVVSPKTPLIDAIALMSGISVSGVANERSEDSYTGGDGYEFRPAALACTPLGDCPTPNRSSCVLVVEDKRPIGIFTERDIVRLAAEQVAITTQPIADIMTAPVISLPADGLRDIFAALFLFRRYSIRHLPIVDRDDVLVGVVSSDGLRQVLRPTNLLKQRRVADVMTSDAIYAPPTSSVLVLAQMMAQHRVSCIVIADDRDAPDLNPVGIVTERDIVQFQALGLDLSRTPAQVVMSTPLSLLEPEDSLWEAHQRMQQLRVRRLVVSWNWGRGLGIVTQTSLLRVFDPMEMFGIIETLQHTVQQLEKEQPDSSVSAAQNSGAKTPEKLANSHSHTHSDSTGDLRVVPPLSSEAKSTALAQIQAGLQDLLNTPTTSQEHQRTCIRKLLALTRQALTAGSPHTAEAPHDSSRESVQNS
ncbi:MAG: CBS domain-containing protein [Cyanobacteria bacterium J06597_1]